MSNHEQQSTTERGSWKHKAEAAIAACAVLLAGGCASTEAKQGVPEKAPTTASASETSKATATPKPEETYTPPVSPEWGTGTLYEISTRAEKPWKELLAYSNEGFRKLSTTERLQMVAAGFIWSSTPRDVLENPELARCNTASAFDDDHGKTLENTPLTVNIKSSPAAIHAAIQNYTALARHSAVPGSGGNESAARNVMTAATDGSTTVGAAQYINWTMATVEQQAKTSPNGLNFICPKEIISEATPFEIIETSGHNTPAVQYTVTEQDGTRYRERVGFHSVELPFIQLAGGKKKVVSMPILFNRETM